MLTAEFGVVVISTNKFVFRRQFWKDDSWSANIQIAECLS